SDVFDASYNIAYAGILEKEIILSSDEYFVMGDNIDESKDSRYSDIGLVREENVIGRICFPIP
ncbi:MAG: S26 family signal peptidase, partial [Wujia sp.]